MILCVLRSTLASWMLLLILMTTDLPQLLRPPLVSWMLLIRMTADVPLRI